MHFTRKKEDDMETGILENLRGIWVQCLGYGLVLEKGMAEWTSTLMPAVLC